MRATLKQREILKAKGATHYRYLLTDTGKRKFTGVDHRGRETYKTERLGFLEVEYYFDENGNEIALRSELNDELFVHPQTRIWGDHCQRTTFPIRY